MAKLSFDGLDDVVKQMEKMGQMGGKVAEEMLLAGAAEMEKAWQESIRRFGHVKYGDMLKSVGSTKIKPVKTGGKTLEVYPKGKDRKGVRNVEKAFILHYGKKGLDASHFVEAAEKEGEPKAAAAMEARWDRFIQKGS